MIAETVLLARRAPRKSFVAKFRTRDDYEHWKREQRDPPLLVVNDEIDPAPLVKVCQLLNTPAPAISSPTPMRRS